MSAIVLTAVDDDQGSIDVHEQTSYIAVQQPGAADMCRRWLASLAAGPQAMISNKLSNCACVIHLFTKVSHISATL